MAFDNKGAKEQLISLLRQPRRALLVVGSGTSISLGYPSWSRLLEELRAAVVPELASFPDIDLLERASLIKKHVDLIDLREGRKDRQRRYEQCLSDQFQPRIPGHSLFHRTLVQLGSFCGFVTTNYDAAIESAATFVEVHNGRDCPCEPIDLCSSKPFLVFKYLRNLPTAQAPSSVLHVHGFWKNPDKLILTTEDYKKSYGLEDHVPTGGALAEPTRPLDTFHRKVVWSLLTMHPAVFVGFGMQDPAFRLILEYVLEDFKLASTTNAHFALMPSRPIDDRDRDALLLGKFGVKPVFYDVITDPSGSEDHTALTTLIEELGASLGVIPTTPSVDSITRRLLER